MNHSPANAPSEALTITREGAVMRLRLKGAWLLREEGLPTVEWVHREVAQGTPPGKLSFDLTGVTGYDTALITFLLGCHDMCQTLKMQFDLDSLTDGPRKLLCLATSVPEAADVRPHMDRAPLFARIGNEALAAAGEAREIFKFLGEVSVATWRLFQGRARFRWSDVWLEVQQCGFDALPIVSLISFLVGLILAYVGSITLRQYGGLIFIANLVGLAMVREMGAMMTGVIMSGRTGAAFAAQLGTMKVSEEIAALQTLGLSPVEFLVLPRMIALFLMFPLLTLYADFIGICGGLVVALSMDLTYNQFVNQLMTAVDLTNFSVGIIKSFAFGLIVAVMGCLRGMQCGNSSAAVGQAATRAVVSGITVMIVADALFAVIFNTLQM